VGLGGGHCCCCYEWSSCCWGERGIEMGRWADVGFEVEVAEELRRAIEH